MTVDLLTEAVPGRSFGVIALRQGYVTERGETELMYDVGCTALLREARRLPDGRFNIITRGERRFRLLDIDDGAGTPYLVGRVEWVPDATVTDDEQMLLPMLAQSAREAHRRYCAAAWQREDWEEPDVVVSPSALPHLLAADCLLTLEDRQELLEERCAASRLRLIRTLLARETEFLCTLRAVPVPLNQFATEMTHN